MRSSEVVWKILVVSFTVFLVSCQSDKPSPRPDVQVTALVGKSNTLIINEGTFQFYNASLSFLSGVDGELKNDIGLNRGWDVIQSLAYVNKKLYVVINNSGEIAIVDPVDFHTLGTISGLRSPRYLLPLSNAKAYVTDIYADAISVIDLNTNKVIKKIPCPGWTEKLIYHLGKVYVCNYRKSYLYVIDPLTDSKIDSIHIGLGAQTVLVDKYDRIVVSCGGYDLKQSENQIVFLNAYTYQIEKRILFTTHYPSNMCLNGSKDSLYFLNTHVYKMSVEDTQVPTRVFVSSEGKTLYGMDVDPSTNRLFVADAVDFVQNGKAYIYTPAGSEVASFPVGKVPNGFYFY